MRNTYLARLKRSVLAAFGISSVVAMAPFAVSQSFGQPQAWQSPIPDTALLEGPILDGQTVDSSIIVGEVAPPPYWIGALPGSETGDVSTMEIPVERFRRSFYQGSEVLGGYWWDIGDAAGGLNQTFEEARISFGLPLGSMDNLLGFRPHFRADHLDGPTVTDVPPVVYDTGVSILSQKKWSNVLSSTVVLTPSVRSDFETSDNAFRLFGLALANWQPREELTISFGVAYFDRADFNWLPVAGVTYLPTPWWKIDATMPRPRIARRLWKNGGDAEGWAYIGGAIAGNTWAVKRDSGMTDELTVRDFQVLAGYEVIAAGNRGMFIEGGYAFGRSIRYERQDIEIDLDDAVNIRASWKF